MAMIEVEPGVSLFVQDWGKGRPFVFIPGWPLDYRIFEYYMMKVAMQGYRAIAMDLRGFGQSDKPWDGNNYDTWADDIGIVIARLKLQNVVLTGYSMGGAIAAHYVARHRDPRVTRMALLGASLPTATPIPKLEKAIANFLHDGVEEKAKLINTFNKLTLTSPISFAYNMWLTSIGMSASLRAVTCGLEELFHRDLEPELSAIEVPTLICHGTKDIVVPFKQAEKTWRLIRNATLVPFKKSGHWLIIDERHKLTETLLTFARAGGAAEAKAA